MERYKIKEEEREKIRENAERDEKLYIEARKREIARKEESMSERQEIHVNLISQVEMKAHTKEMRAEMDRKFVKCLMITGLDMREAIRRVKTWNAQWGSEKHGN